MNELFNQQVGNLQEPHFLILYWVAAAEDKRTPYNITNGFDDLKFRGITRTKQTAVAVIDALQALRFVDVRDEGNRKNMYITSYGAKALEMLVLRQAFRPQKSVFLEDR